MTYDFGFLSIAISDKSIITCPNADNDWLIAQPSLNLAPVAPVCPDFSDPARSINYTWEDFTFLGGPDVISF